MAVACGKADLVVLDIDAHPSEVPDRSRLLPGIPIPLSVNLAGLVSGFDTLALLAAFRRQQNPAEDEQTLRVRTPSGGLHVWYRNPNPRTRFRSSTGSSPKVALAWQVDVRAEGGYIIAPTTRLAHGIYEPVGSARVPAPLPDWLIAELTRSGHAIEPPPPRRSMVSPLQGRSPRVNATAFRILDALVTEVAQCAAAPQGMAFTEKLNRAAYTAGGLIAAGYLDQVAVRDALTAVADEARPWQGPRNHQIIHDGLAAGIARPFHLEGH